MNLATEEKASLLCQFCWQGTEVEAISGHLHAETADSGNIVAAHLRCMQYASGLTQYKSQVFGGFDISDVEKEIARGKKLRCFICRGVKGKRSKGACCGCAIKSCRKTFHFTCAQMDTVSVTKRLVVTKSSTDLSNKFVLYRVFCSPAHEMAFRKNLSEELHVKTRKKRGRSVEDQEEDAKHPVTEEHSTSLSSEQNSSEACDTLPAPNGTYRTTELENSCLLSSPVLSSTSVNDTCENDDVYSTEASDVHSTTLENSSSVLSPSSTNSNGLVKESGEPGFVQSQGVKDSQPLLFRLNEELSTLHHADLQESQHLSASDETVPTQELQTQNGVKSGHAELLSSSSSAESTENKTPNVLRVLLNRLIKVPKTDDNDPVSVENGLVHSVIQPDNLSLVEIPKTLPKRRPGRPPKALADNSPVSVENGLVHSAIESDNLSLVEIPKTLPKKRPGRPPKALKARQAQQDSSCAPSQTNFASHYISKTSDIRAGESKGLVSRRGAKSGVSRRGTKSGLVRTSALKTVRTRPNMGRTRLGLRSKQVSLLARTCKSLPSTTVLNHQICSQIKMDSTPTKNGIVDGNLTRLKSLKPSSYRMKTRKESKENCVVSARTVKKRKSSSEMDDTSKSESSDDLVVEVCNRDDTKHYCPKQKKSELSLGAGDDSQEICKLNDDTISNSQDFVIAVPSDMAEFELNESKVIETTAEILKISTDRVHVWQKVTVKSLLPELIVFFMLDLVKEYKNGNCEAVVDLLFDGDYLNSRVNSYLVSQIFQSVTDEEARQNILAAVWSGLDASVKNMPMMRLISTNQDLATLAIDIRGFKLGSQVVAYMQAYKGLHWWKKDTKAVAFSMSPSSYSAAVETEVMAVKKWLTKVNPITQLTILPTEDVFWDSVETVANKFFFALVEDLQKETLSALLVQDATGTSLQTVVPLLVFQPLDFLLVNFREYFRKACKIFFQKSCLVTVLALVPLSNFYSVSWESLSSLLNEEGMENEYTMSVSSAFCPSEYLTTMVLLEITRHQQQELDPPEPEKDLSEPEKSEPIEQSSGLGRKRTKPKRYEQP